jgi:hypothetical protein
MSRAKLTLFFFSYDRHPLPDFAVDLPNLYKRSIVFFRALHSYVRLLPGYDLYRKLHKLKNDSNPLSIGSRLSSSSTAVHAGEISLGILNSPLFSHQPTNIIFQVQQF